MPEPFNILHFNYQILLRFPFKVYFSNNCFNYQILVFLSSKNNIFDRISHNYK